MTIKRDIYADAVLANDEDGPQHASSYVPTAAFVEFASAPMEKSGGTGDGATSTAKRVNEAAVGAHGRGHGDAPSSLLSSSTYSMASAKVIGNPDVAGPTTLQSPTSSTVDANGRTRATITIENSHHHRHDGNSPSHNHNLPHGAVTITTPARLYTTEAWETKMRRRKRRQNRMFLSAMGGVVVGGIFFGPLGAVAGAAGAAAVTRKILKNAERRKDRRVANESRRNSS